MRVRPRLVVQTSHTCSSVRDGRAARRTGRAVPRPRLGSSGTRPGGARMALLATPAPWAGPRARGHAPLAARRLGCRAACRRRVETRALAPGRASNIARRGPSRVEPPPPNAARRLARRRGPARDAQLLAPRARSLSPSDADDDLGTPGAPLRARDPAAAAAPPPHPRLVAAPSRASSAPLASSRSRASSSASSARSASRRPSASARSPTRTPSRAWCPRSSSSPSEDSTDPSTAS